MFGVRNVSVHFGEVPALDDVSFDVAPGTVSTVVGGDGAGKTTLLRVLAGRVVPERGTVSAPTGRDLGMLPASAGSWANLTVRQNLEFVASVFGLSRSQAAARSSELIELAGLQTAHDRLGSALSGGMRRKLGVIMALVGHPRLVLLDEPSSQMGGTRLVTSKSTDFALAARRGSPESRVVCQRRRPWSTRGARRCS